MDEFKIACHYCKDLFFFGQLTKDHIVPKSIGGRDIVENVVPSCGKCNQEKGNEFPTCGCKFCINAVDYFNQQFEGLPVIRKTWEAEWKLWKERQDAARNV